jgi:V/A-type H+-transporting ATPase subunit K
LAVLALGSLVMLFAGAGMALAQGDQAATAATAATGWAFLGASLAAGLACIGAGIAVAVVGAAALGVVGEKPELLGSTLIYLGLAEGIAIYGLITALLILGKV